MKNWLVGLLAISVVDISIVDSKIDHSKTLVNVIYSDGKEEALVVDKKLFMDPKNEDTIVSVAMKMIKARTGK